MSEAEQLALRVSLAICILQQLVEWINIVKGAQTTVKFARKEQAVLIAEMVFTRMELAALHAILPAKLVQILAMTFVALASRLKL